MNRLATELSPYLLEHAENPVDWYPWGPEALARARALDRPILVSIGYSACHWCHVMARESFSSPAIAAQMNAELVCVKIDREERPDLDQIYQLVVQRMGRAGGWPLTVFLTPDAKPFFGGTYFPDVPRYGMPSFPEVLGAVAESWRTRRAELEAGAAEVTEEIVRLAATPAARAEGEIPADAALVAARRLARRFDEKHGGFGARPKFPSTMSLDVMLRAAHAGDDASLARVRKALDAMADGGIADQLGGGFHRYSTDERWLVPHFEKMLYDNALLLRTYADAAVAAGEPRYREVCAHIVGWAEREMSAPDGTFYSSQDADSEGEEGRFFVWRPEEIDALLPAGDARVAKLAFGVSEAGNFERTGASVLHVARPVAAVAQALGMGEDAVREALERARAALFSARERRVRPLCDDKILATWNGLFLGALAHAGAALGERAWVERARRGLAVFAAEVAGSAPLVRVRRGGAKKGVSFLDDHADLAGAALDVFEAADEPSALALARELVERALASFWDEASSSFDLAPRELTDLVARPRDAFDHATPSGAASMVHALLRLASHVEEPRYERIADAVLRALGPTALEHPGGLSHLVCAVDRAARGPVEIVIVAPRGDATGEALLEAARRAWCPNRVLARAEPGSRAGLGRRVPGTDAARAAAYVCRNRTCERPIFEAAALAEALAGGRTGETGSAA